MKGFITWNDIPISKMKICRFLQLYGKGRILIKRAGPFALNHN